MNEGAAVRGGAPAALREAAERAAELLDHLADYDQRNRSHVDCGGEPGRHDPLVIEAVRLRAALSENTVDSLDELRSEIIAGFVAPSGTLGKYLTAEQLRAYSDELERLREVNT